MLRDPSGLSSSRLRPRLRTHGIRCTSRFSDDFEELQNSHLTDLYRSHIKVRAAVFWHNLLTFQPGSVTQVKKKHADRSHARLRIKWANPCGNSNGKLFTCGYFRRQPQVAIACDCLFLVPYTCRQRHDLNLPNTGRKKNSIAWKPSTCIQLWCFLTFSQHQ